MKKLFSLMFGVIMVLFLFAGCGNKNDKMNAGFSSQSAEENALLTKSADVSTIESNVYTSKLLGLKYTAAEDMTLASVELINKLNQEYKDRLNGMSLDMYCSINGENKSTIRVELMKLENPDTTYEQILSTVTKDDDSDENKHSVEKCKLCNMEFTKISYAEFPNSKRLVKKADEYIVIINIVATDNENVDKLLSGFSKVDES